MDIESVRACLQLIVDAIHEARRKLDNPIIIVAGDFNQHKINEALEEHVDIREAR
jgi:hypothetical protein